MGLGQFRWLLRAAKPLWQQLPVGALSKDFCCWGAGIRGAVELVQSRRWGSEAEGAQGWSSSFVGRKPRAPAESLLLGQTFEKPATIPVCRGNQPDWRQSSYLQLDQSLFLYITFPRGMFRWDAALHFIGTAFFQPSFRAHLSQIEWLAQVGQRSLTSARGISIPAWSNHAVFPRLLKFIFLEVLRKSKA